jgi:hypothetical protein
MKASQTLIFIGLFLVALQAPAFEAIHSVQGGGAVGYAAGGVSYIFTTSPGGPVHFYRVQTP